MKRLMVSFFFPCDYDEILFYTSYSHRQANFFQKDSSENLNIYSFRENENLDFIYEMKISIQEAGLEDQQFEERSCIKDDVLEEVFKEAKEENMELVEG